MSVYDIIKNRRTIRKFSQNPIDKEVLLKCIDAARVSPCGANKQPLKYKIINDFETVQQICPLVRWAAYISPYGNPTKDEQPTAFIAVTVDTNIKPNGYETDTCHIRYEIGSNIFKAF